MDIELQAQLRSAYPAIFANWDKPLSESAMPFGLECGDGWFDTLNALCRALQALTDQEGAPQAVAAQVKQKFGTLRLHFEGQLNGQQSDLVLQAQAQSALTCEECGRPGELIRLTPRKVVTRCVVHAAAC